MSFRAWLLIVGLLAAGVPARAAELTIADMLEEARAMAGKGAPDGAALQQPESDYVRTMKAMLEREFNRKAKDAQNDVITMGDLYFDIQNFDAALGYWTTALQRFPNDWRVRRGELHQRLCRLYTIKDRKELAEQMLDEAIKRAPDPGALHRLDRLKDWVKDYPVNSESAKDLKAKVEANPGDADARWKLLGLYREAYPMRLDEFVGLLRFREAFPKDERAAVSGDCDWRLMEVMMHFGITDEGMSLAEKFREKFPASRISTYGDACWRLGEWSGWLGRSQAALNYYRELREKYPKHWGSTGGEAVWRMGEIYRSFNRWQEALDCFKEVRDKYGKHWTCNPPPGQQATIQERIFEATKNGAR